MSVFEVSVFESLADVRYGTSGPLAEWKFEVSADQVRFVQRGGVSGVPEFQAGVRLFDGDGRYATDVEHDGAWLLRVDAASLAVTLFDATVTAVGVLESRDGLRAHAPDAALAEILADGEECDRCEDPHLVGVAYLGPVRAPKGARVVRVSIRW